jgi:transposase
VRSYKALAEIERAFRSMKTIDLHIRPIHHRLEERVRARVFPCMLAYYVEWHMREAWRELMFADEDLERKKHRDPLPPPEPIEAAFEKLATRKLKNG